MSEKDTQETLEETQTEEVTEEVEASAEEVVEEVQDVQASSDDSHEEAEVTAETDEPAPEESADTNPGASVVKKGLMERRPSYSQSSVPNAHKGYSGTPPVIMLLIVSVFILLSIIFATAAIN